MLLVFRKNSHDICGYFFEAADKTDDLDLSNVEKGDLLIISTGWEKKWHTRILYRIPCFIIRTCEKLVHIGIKALATDLSSVDSEDSPGTVCKILLGNGIIIIESLLNIFSVPVRNYDFYDVTLKIRGSNGSPARAFAVIP